MTVVSMSSLIIDFSKPANWTQFRLALLASDFDEWAAICPVKASALIASVYADKIEEAKMIFAMIAASHPPSEDQLQRWQAIADQHSIKSIKFA